jgi:hypothetical protein
LTFLQVLLNPKCRLKTYIDHLSVDPETGVEGKHGNNVADKRIRAESGLESASGLFANAIPLWDPLIQALSKFGERVSQHD